MKEKILLAIDQSTTATGWAIFKGKTLVDQGVYSPSGNREERIDKTKKWLEDAIVELSAKGELTIALEDIQMQANVETYKSLAQLQGVLINSTFNKKQEELITEYPVYYASAWKSTCNVKGKKRAEQKANAKKFVLDTFNVDAAEDACDAICIGYHHLNGVVEELNFE